MADLDQSMLGATLDSRLTERRAASKFFVLFDIDNIDIDCSELMGSKASDVAVVGSRYTSSEAIVRQLVILTSTPPP